MLAYFPASVRPHKYSSFSRGMAKSHCKQKRPVVAILIAQSCHIAPSHYPTPLTMPVPHSPLMWHSSRALSSLLFKGLVMVFVLRN